MGALTAFLLSPAAHAADKKDLAKASLSFAKRMASTRVPLARSVGHERTILTAIDLQNVREMSLSEIKAIDAAWIADARYPLRKELTSNSCAEHLKKIVAKDSMIVEALVMDNQGALVCATEETSDYWQGDEAKWQRVFADKKGKFVDYPRLDKSTQVFAAQFSSRIEDRRGKPVGVLTLTMRFKASAVAASR